MADITYTQLQKDFKQLSNHLVALEGFHRVLEGQESVSGQTAQAMVIAIEAVDPDLVKSGYDGVTGKDLVNGVKKTYNTLTRVLKFLLREIGKLIEKIGLVMQHLGKRKENLDISFRDMSRTSEPKSTELSQIGGQGLLYVDGEFMGGDPAQLSMLIKAVDYLWVTYPSRLVQVMDHISRGAIHYKDDADAFKKIVVGAIATIGLPDLPRLAADTYYDHGIEGGDLIATIPFLGNVGIVMRDPKSAGKFVEGGDVGDALAFKLIPFADDAPQNTAIPTPSIETIGQLKKGLDKLFTLLEKPAVISTDLRKAISDMEKVADTLEAANGQGKESTTEIATMIGAIVGALGEPLQKIVPLIARVTNAEINYLEKAIAQYS